MISVVASNKLSTEYFIIIISDDKVITQTIPRAEPHFFFSEGEAYNFRTDFLL